MRCCSASSLALGGRHCPRTGTSRGRIPFLRGYSALTGEQPLGEAALAQLVDSTQGRLGWASRWPGSRVEIVIVVELQGYDDDDAAKAILGSNFTLSHSPLTARLLGVSVNYLRKRLAEAVLAKHPGTHTSKTQYSRTELRRQARQLCEAGASIRDARRDGRGIRDGLHRRTRGIGPHTTGPVPIHPRGPSPASDD